MDTTQPIQPIKFDKAFTPEVDIYIEYCQRNNIPPTIKGFAERIKTDEKSIWAWATKNRKDEQGNTTSELARPNFFASIKRLEKLEKESQPKEQELTPKQELFCKLYASDKEFFANGVQSYIVAYGIDTNKPGAYNSARSSAYDLLTNLHILKRIDELLEVESLNDSAVDKELAFVIIQKADLGSKVAAIREYNKLKARIIEKMDLTTKGKELPQPIMGGITNVSKNNSNN
jgi:hypothetical protein